MNRWHWFGQQRRPLYSCWKDLWAWESFSIINFNKAIYLLTLDVVRLTLNLLRVLVVGLLKISLTFLWKLPSITTLPCGDIRPNSPRSRFCLVVGVTFSLYRLAASILRILGIVIAFWPFTCFYDFVLSFAWRYAGLYPWKEDCEDILDRIVVLKCSAIAVRWNIVKLFY